MSQIDKKEIKHLAELAKIQLTKHEPDDAKALSGEEEKLLKNFEEILDYFEELKQVDTSNVEPMTGGTASKNVFREDEKEIRSQINGSPDDLIEAFPEKEGRFLKVPPVFE